jgi:hypothetical protein
MHEDMTKEGWERVAVEHSVYIKRTKDGHVSIVGVHVDDCLATANSPEAMKDVKHCMRKHFEIADLGPVKWILGISVERNRKEKNDITRSDCVC